LKKTPAPTTTTTATSTHTQAGTPPFPVGAVAGAAPGTKSAEGVEVGAEVCAAAEAPVAVVTVNRMVPLTLSPSSEITR
jgi:hypothetical protein